MHSAVLYIHICIYHLSNIKFNLPIIAVKPSLVWFRYNPPTTEL
nr:MAG TPA: hypothetical protein [Caudoviricetes sp.]